MKLQTLEEIEKTLCGRPKTSAPKRRHSFYLSTKESELLKNHVRDNDTTVSEIIRNLVKPLLKA